ncbi:MAG: inorganic phosphate transporter [Candidatus Thiodiazotropha lotti]|uniref:Inorganic phosphate transporter n=1 Tax=Candidatus Thiodiazotropha lotti TaxID=2792787 RepID=A0A9E4K774_9GAMM|nr:inorganic phosphate transporter [Candidatus Thiodiazotropha lotti]MCG7920542.1 inorganic phosphate transporter [Candidatus Thiodiazotropha lotti]MCG7930586.1 inorganic phosphate transporter [Candidatus Thiodiazotropha lotti]MCG7940136.1 inorganic phosphate transporter [Candidatus Thiodiazotropha lotti]MCG7988338.1 inorganic phosphate transporter [Candidatus Thiodiazotropha lotti]
MTGTIGIAVGLALYGPKLIKTVDQKSPNWIRPGPTALLWAAAITVIIAIQLGLPESSTHIAVGAIFGVGFLREYLKANSARIVDEIEMHHQGSDRDEVESFLEKFKAASIDDKAAILNLMKEHKANADLSKKERKGLKKVIGTSWSNARCC